MSGNVWEWCHDWYLDKYYNDSPDKNPLGLDNGTYKVFRGGSWISDRKFLRCANRGKNTPEYKSPSLGFRCGIGFIMIGLLIVEMVLWFYVGLRLVAVLTGVRFDQDRSDCIHDE